MNPRLLSQETRAAFRAEHLAQQPSTAPLSAAAGAALTAGVEHLLLLCVHAHVRFRGVAAVEQLRAAYRGLGLSVSGGKHTHAAVFGGANATLFIVNAADKPASVTVHGRSRHFQLAMAPWDVHIGALSGKK